MVVSPTSSPYPSPFADPSDLQNHRRASLASAGSGTSLSPMKSPIENNGFSYGYVGPAWRGGAASQVGATPEGGDKWWHALCAWGSDLDGADENDQSGQAGRTNPFE